MSSHSLFSSFHSQIFAMTSLFTDKIWPTIYTSVHFIDIDIFVVSEEEQRENSPNTLISSWVPTTNVAFQFFSLSSCRRLASVYLPLYLSVQQISHHKYCCNESFSHQIFARRSEKPKNTKTPKLTAKNKPAFSTKNITKASRLNELILTY